MKYQSTQFRILLGLVFLVNSHGYNLKCQSIDLVPYPRLTSYLGSPIIYKNDLYINFYTNSYYLAKYSNFSIDTIPNPPSVLGYVGTPIVYQDKLFMRYQISFWGGFQLAVYDGTSIKLIPNPAGTLSYYGSPIVYKDKLYLDYQISYNTYQLFEFDGNIFVPVENPVDASLSFPDPQEKFKNSYPIIFNDKLYLEYKVGIGNSAVRRLAEYNGAKVTLINHPTGGSAYTGYPTLFNNKLCFQYNVNAHSHLSEYDGVNPIQSVSNPNSVGHLYVFSPTIFRDKLVVSFQTAGVSELANYDGKKIVVVPNPSIFFGYNGNPLVLHDRLYFCNGANTQNQTTRLGYYDGTSISSVPNPYPLRYENQLTAYHNKLYLRYNGYTLQYDGAQLGLVFDSSNSPYGYNGSSIIFHDTLFFGDQYGAFGDNQLAYLTSYRNAVIAGAYRSKKSGDWALPSSWERYDGSNWLDASTIPSSNAESITIRNSHTISITTANTGKKVVVEEGATLTCTSIFDLADRPGDDLAVYGTLQLSDGELKGAGGITINGTLNWIKGTISANTVLALTGSTINSTSSAAKLIRTNL